MYINSLLITTVFLMSFLPIAAQERTTAIYGSPESKEILMKSYKIDQEAPGVVLFESCKYYVEVIKNSLRLVKEVHIKTKVFDINNFDQATVSIHLYGKNRVKEELLEIEAITHNQGEKIHLKNSAIYSEDSAKELIIKKFTFPNVQNGSILEYRYKAISPYFLYLDDWKFQGTLPIIYSEIETEIPGNYVYNKALTGNYPLFIDEEYIKEDCLSIPNATDAACVVSIFAMKDMPAFASEPYMLSKDNYLPQLKYTLKEYYDFDRNKIKVTTEWEDVEKELRRDKDLGKQLGYESYFKKKLPEEILNINDTLVKAQEVFHFIQRHFNFNGKSRYLSDIRVKEAFEKQSGNSGEINLALVNALSAAGISADIALISTRDRALPTKLHPQLSDFNYVLAMVTIHGKEILLDATEKTLQFGMLPKRTLNLRARVIGFEHGSKWLSIEPFQPNTSMINAQLSIDTIGNVSGNVLEKSTGYYAYDVRSQLNNKTISDYLQFKTNGTYKISNYANSNKYNLEEDVTENYTVSYEIDQSGSKYFIYPFSLKPFFTENPFKLDKRDFAIDFSYPFNHAYVLKLEAPKGFSFKEVPKNRAVKLPENLGLCTIMYNATNEGVYVRYTLKMDSYHISARHYQNLKDFFDTVVTMLNKEVLVLEKV